jgi:hypothetical protein
MMADVCELLFAEDIGHQVRQPASQVEQAGYSL